VRGDREREGGERMRGEGRERGRERREAKVEDESIKIDSR
jgi:hypothetical protein